MLEDQAWPHSEKLNDDVYSRVHNYSHLNNILYIFVQIILIINHIISNAEVCIQQNEQSDNSQYLY